MVCPIGAIFPDYGLASDQHQFIEINNQFSKKWPSAIYKGPLKDADNWALEKNKVKLIEDY